MARPIVSILLAVRNEEKNILDCLQALNALDFDKTQIQILIGDDDSQDQTAAIIRDFIAQKPHFQLIHILQEQKLKAKANVLAQLAHLAQADFWLITDADIVVPTSWAKAMLAQAQHEKVAIVTGFTKIITQKKPFSAGLLSHFQAIDWLFVLGIIQTAAQLGFWTSTMGNNMLIRKEAYWQTGGYEKIPFSVTEDFALFQEVQKLNWHFRQVCHPEILVGSKAIPTWGQLLQQRKRWTKGAMRLPYGWLVVAFTYLSMLPLIFLGMCWSNFLGIALFILYSIILISILGVYAFKTQQKYLFYFLPLYLPMSLVFNFVWLIYFLLPIKFNWKGRNF